MSDTNEDAPNPGLPPEEDKPDAPKTYAPGYPKTLYHPVHGAVEIGDPLAESQLNPRHDYFNTPEEADMHRTDREAGLAVLKNETVKLEEAEEKGVVRNSVAAQESLDEGNPEPL